MENPSPLHSSQAPRGELKENERGEISSITIPHSGQANFVEKIKSSPSITFTFTMPSDKLVASSKDSNNLDSIFSFMIILSITTSISVSYTHLRAHET